MFKKILIFILCFSILAAFCACGKQSPTTNATNPSENTNNFETEPENNEIEDDIVVTVPQPVEQEPTNLGGVILDEKLLTLGTGLTKETIEKMGYKIRETPSVSISHDYFSIVAYRAEKGDTDFLVSFDESGKLTLIGIEPNEEDSANITFFKGISSKSSIEEIKEALKDCEFDDESNLFITHLFHDKNHTIYAEYDDHREEMRFIFAALTNDLGLNPTDEDKARIDRDKLFEFFACNDYTTFKGYREEINCESDISKIELEGKEFDFTKLTIDDLRDIGYTTQGDEERFITNGYDQSLLTIYAMEQINEQGAVLSCIYNEEGQIIYLRIETIPPEGDFHYDPEDVQANYKVLGNITPTTKWDDAEKTVQELVTKRENGWLVKSDNMCMYFSVGENIKSIMIVNTDLAWKK